MSSPREHWDLLPKLRPWPFGRRGDRRTRSVRFGQLADSRCRGPQRADHRQCARTSRPTSCALPIRYFDSTKSGVLIFADHGPNRGRQSGIWSAPGLVQLDRPSILHRDHRALGFPHLPELESSRFVTLVILGPVSAAGWANGVQAAAAACSASRRARINAEVPPDGSPRSLGGRVRAHRQGQYPTAEKGAEELVLSRRARIACSATSPSR